MTLEERVQAIEERQEAILRFLWDLRGKNKGIANRAEKELGEMWDEYLKSKESPDLPTSTRTD